MLVAATKRPRKRTKAEPPAKAAKVATGAAKPVSAPQPDRSDSQTKKAPSPPPIVVQDKSAWTNISAALNARHIQFTHAKACAEGIRVSTPDAKAYRSMQAFLNNRNIQYHTYTPAEDRKIRAVVRGVPKEVDTDAILDDLKAQGLPALEVHRLFKSRTREPFNLIQVVLEPTAKGKDIFKIKTICHIGGLKIETPYKRSGPGQCHRCQLYGHAAANCYARPRCVKCLGDHGTSDCSRKRETATDPPACVLCGQAGHTANYRGCTRAPRAHPQKPARPQTAARPPAQHTALPALRPHGHNAWAKPLNWSQGSTPAPAPRLPATASASPTAQEAPRVAAETHKVSAAPQRAPALTPTVNAAPKAQVTLSDPRPTAPKAPGPPRDPRTNAPKAATANVPSTYRDNIKLLTDLAQRIDPEEVGRVAAEVRANLGDLASLICVMHEHRALFAVLKSFGQQ